MTASPLLEVRDLRISFDTPDGPLWAVNGASFAVGEGEVLALLGESGSGKSATAKAVMGILPIPPGRIVSGEVIFEGRDLIPLPPKERRLLMGRRLGWIPQDPLSSLDPSFTIGYQLTETLRRHSSLNRTEARAAAVASLAAVDLPRPERLLTSYAHELSGGMRQRVLIAMALAPKPSLLIADEPTTALDVTVQAEIMSLLRSLQQEMRMSIILITHDSTLSGTMADRVAIMYAGSVVEQGRAQEVFLRPAHPYTAGLLRATPSLTASQQLYTIPGTPPKLLEEPTACSFADRCEWKLEICEQKVPDSSPLSGDRSSRCFEAEAVLAQPSIIQSFLTGSAAAGRSSEATDRDVILSGRGLTKIYWESGRRSRKADGEEGKFTAVDRVDVELRIGETLCVVGESGSGKSTLARILLGLIPFDEGTVEYEGQQILSPSMPMRREMRRRIQFVAQDPYSSLNRRMPVGRIISEGWRANPGVVAREDEAETLSDLLSSVGISVQNAVRRLPHEFSGGQRQRIAIARALAMRPSVLILDEPVSSLDVSVQAQVINLLKQLQVEKGYSYIFITHDLSIVRAFGGKVAVMRQGQVVEQGDSEHVFDNPSHVYTQKLLDSNPQWEATGKASIRRQTPAA